MKSRCAVLEFIVEELILDSESLSDNIRGYKLAKSYCKYSAHLMFLKGLSELRGTGTSMDADLAMRSLDQAYSMGSMKAAGVLGYLYDCGDVIAKDVNLAFDYYLEAAHGGDVDAMVNVAACYYDGVGVAVNHGKSSAWMRRAKRSYACQKMRLEHCPFDNDENEIRTHTPSSSEG